MATVDITAHMIPSRYGETDQWVTAEQLRSSKRVASDWIELRMHCRYTRRTERFSVLYQGPGGKMRLDHGRPEVPGPVGSLIAQCSVIASTPVARARYIDVVAGDVLVINGQRMVIVDDNPHGYPRLVSEVEVGILAAASYVRNRLINEIQPYADIDGKTDVEIDREVELERVKWQTRMAVLAEVFTDITALGPVLREQHATPAKR